MQQCLWSVSYTHLYTEDTLLSAMETAGNDQFDDDTEKKGLGTPATRAGIIEKHFLRFKITFRNKISRNA